jgi:hypothetical protein
MGTNIRKWFTIGTRKCLSLASIFTACLLNSPHSTAREAWNVVTVAQDASSEASANVLDGIVIGFTAFRDAELKGVEERKRLLAEAANSLKKGTEQMFFVGDLLVSDTTGTTPILYEQMSQSDKLTLVRWTQDFQLKQPTTWSELYGAGTKSTEALAEKYIELSQRDDAAVFGEFLDVTNSYLKASALASEIFSTKGQ